MKQLKVFLIIFFSTVISIEVKQFISFKDIADPNFTIHTLLQEDETQEFVLEIPKGYCYRVDNIITQEGHLLKDPLITTYDRLHLAFPGEVNAHVYFCPERVAIVSCCWSHSYYHWLLQALTRIIVLHHSDVKYDRIYMNCQKHKWQIDSLKIILAHYGIDYARVIVEPGITDKALQAKMLIVPSIPFAFNFHSKDKNPSLYQKPRCPQWLLQELRAIFLHAQPDAHPEESYERIYISRAKASKRKVTNETLLIEELEKRNFKIIYLEELSLFEQARIFNKARIIVGPHGAGFANVIFAQPGYVLVELEHFLIDVSQRQYFTELATFTSGIHFQYYVDRVTKKKMDKSMIVPVKKFVVFLDNILRHLKN